MNPLRFTAVNQRSPRTVRRDALPRSDFTGAPKAAPLAIQIPSAESARAEGLSTPSDAQEQQNLNFHPESNYYFCKAPTSPTIDHMT
jgi:hypothetical protein